MAKMCPGCGRPCEDELVVAPTLGERVAEVVAAVGSSWSFVGVMALILGVWIGASWTGLSTFDPSLILLNLWISVITTFQGPVIMMSQNRIAAKDRHRAEENYEVNARTEVLLRALAQKVEQLTEGSKPPPSA